MRLKLRRILLCRHSAHAHHSRRVCAGWRQSIEFALIPYLNLANCMTVQRGYAPS